MNNTLPLQSTLDTDLYKLSMAQVIYHYFPKTKVRYKFYNRKNIQFPEGFAHKLQERIEMMSDLRASKSEILWLGNISFMRPTWVEWFAGYRYNTTEVTISQTGGRVEIQIEGYWYRTIHWEVALMALICETYYEMTNTNLDPDWESRIQVKAEKLSKAGCFWLDFGTRRRRGFFTQDKVVATMKKYPGFLGTSNPYLAWKYGVTAQGTYAHEAIMGVSAIVGARMANKIWMKYWADFYEGNLGVALTDTFTTEGFLQDFTSYEARLFDGVRHDSSDPIVWGERMLAHYAKLKIPAENKRLVFSDNLNPDTYIPIHQRFQGRAQPCAGIGTNFSNDCGVSPLNIVIKLDAVNYEDRGFVPVVKLSDDEGKHTGNSELIERIKGELNLRA